MTNYNICIYIDCINWPAANDETFTVEYSDVETRLTYWYRTFIVVYGNPIVIGTLI